jgi:hypothetical protein
VVLTSQEACTALAAAAIPPHLPWQRTIRCTTSICSAIPCHHTHGYASDKLHWATRTPPGRPSNPRRPEWTAFSRNVTQCFIRHCAPYHTDPSKKKPSCTIQGKIHPCATQSPADKYQQQRPFVHTCPELHLHRGGRGVSPRLGGVSPGGFFSPFYE